MTGPQLPFSDHLHSSKYRAPGESFEESQDRVSAALTLCPEQYQATRDVLRGMRFMAGGRVQSACGSPKLVTPYNCFVSGTIADSFVHGEGSIMDRAKEAATTMRMGGGIGYSFSTLRPRGATIRKLGSVSSGPVAFMDIFNAVCHCTASSGNRRGAQMGVLRVDHPDIIEFINAKQNTDRLTGFNVSVAVTDEFMRAVEAGGTFDLRWGGEVWETIDARTLWETVMRSTYQWAEPGVLFIDAINRENNLGYCETIVATNPCFTGDTRVWTAEHGQVAFRDLLGETLHVLTQTEEGRLVYRVMSNIRRTKQNARLVRVNFDNGTSLRCTPSHEFFLRDGRVKSAKDLAQGDSLCSVYRYRANSKGYMRLSNGVSAPLEHHVPFEDVEGLGNTINGIKHDNRPGNLRLMYAGDHLRHHMEGDQNPLRRMPDRNPMKLDLDCTRGEKNGRWRADLCTEAMIEMREAGFSYRDVAKQFGCSPYTARKRVLDANHRIVSVEFLDEREDVFCGTVDDPTHRFFVSLGDHDGVLVANCGEQPLPPNGACLLGSFNLAQYMRLTEPSWAFDWDRFRADIPLIVRAMDRVVDTARFPLEAQREEALAKRRMGLGITALANAGEALGRDYGTDEFLTFEMSVLMCLRDEAYRASVQLARELGPFPAFRAEEYLARPFIRRLPKDIQEGIARWGVRNSHLLSIAPTGTISLCADNVSSGIEPVFSYRQRRVVKTTDGQEEHELEDYGVRVFGVRGRRAEDVHPLEHLKVLAVAQEYVDSSVSKTINVPKDIPWEDFKDVYMQAWRTGCKGCTTYRPGKRGAVLTSVDEEAAPRAEAACSIDPVTGRQSCE